MKKIIKLISLLIIVGGIFYFESDYANAAEYYVDKDSRGGACSDSKAGTITQPWCTIGKANSTLQAGDTVYIRGGTYTQQIKPANNGSSGNYITYAKYQSEAVTIRPSGVQADLNGKGYINIDGLRFEGVNGSWSAMTGASYCILENNYFKGGQNTWGGLYIDGDAHHNKILNNTLTAECHCTTPACGGGPKDLVWMEYASYNLFEGNDFQYGPHGLIDFQGRDVPERNTGNIIRNNIMYNPWHTSLALFDGAQRNLVEGNTIYDSGENAIDNWCTGIVDDRTKSREKHGGIQLGSRETIIRNNILINNGAFSVSTKDNLANGSFNNRIYNNTLYHNYFGIYTNSLGDVYGNIYKNNIINNQEVYSVFFSISSGKQDDNTHVFNNLTGGTITYKSATGSISTIAAAYPSEWQENQSFDPEFINPVNESGLYKGTGIDLHLQSSSSMINAGDFLTTTTSVGSGVSISVNDASYFTDGWGLIEGDMVQLQGQTATARIIDVDYNTNTITVNTNLSWTSGQGVALTYSGSKPDMGAYEYGGEAPPSSCTENWSCMEWSGWSECINNQQSHTRVCTDLNNCGTTVNKPIESETQVCSSDGSVIKEFTQSEDTLISSGYSGSVFYADYNYGNMDTFYVGARQDGSRDRVLLKFPDLIALGNIPEGSTIVSATLTLTNTGSHDYAGGYELKTRKILESWSEGNNSAIQADGGETSWNWRLYNTNRWSSDTDNDGGSNAGCSEEQSHTLQNEIGYTYSAAPGEGNQINLDVTGIVQEWAASGENTNNGFILLAPAVEGTTKNYIRFASSENANASYRPKLTVVLGSAVEPTSYGLSDFVNLMTDWLKTAIGSPADVNNDGKVNSRDLGIMMHGWGIDY